MSTRTRLTVLAGVLCCALGACASTSSTASRTSITAVDPPPISTTLAPPTTTRPLPCRDDADAVKSFAPDGVPSSPALLSDSIIDRIRARGYLIVGVDENTIDFSARDPLTGVIDGLEVDIARQLAQAILGDPGKVRLKTLVTAQKVPYAADGTVDLTVSAVSMTCARWGLVDFSTEYYTAQHKLLVRSDSDIGGIQDLAGRRVCVTTGSSSVKVLADKAPSATIQVPLEARTDCLAALQEGTVEAYFSHDSILRGMQKQDPTTKILDQAVTPQHYGIAIAKDHPEFVRFVNSVFERMRADGTLAGIYDKWLGDGAPPVPPAAYRS